MTRIVSNYPELFGEQTTNTLGPTEGFAAKYGWYQSLFALSKGNIERIENITKLKFHQCFYMLAFMKDKTELENKQIKKQFK